MTFDRGRDASAWRAGSPGASVARTLVTAAAAVLAVAAASAAEATPPARPGAAAQARPSPDMTGSTTPRQVQPMPRLSMPPLRLERRTFPNNPHAKIQR